MFNRREETKVSIKVEKRKFYKVFMSSDKQGLFINLKINVENCLTTNLFTTVYKFGKNITTL